MEKNTNCLISKVVADWSIILIKCLVELMFNQAERHAFQLRDWPVLLHCRVCLDSAQGVYGQYDTGNTEPASSSQ